MTATPSTDSWGTYVVEHYRPGHGIESLQTSAVRLREAADALVAEGKAVRFVRSTIVPGDEAILCIFEAASEELVREAYVRANQSFERISAAIPG